MLAGCSFSSLALYNFPSMSTQRLNLPCNFTRKDTSKPKPVRPIGVSIEKTINTKTSSCSLTTQDCFCEKGKSLKRFGKEQDESQLRAKRKRRISKSDDCFQYGENLSLSQYGSGNLTNFWFQHSLEVPKSFSLISGLDTPQVPFSISPRQVDDDKDKVFNTWAVTEKTKLGKKNTEDSYTYSVQEPSESSSSSDKHSHSLSLKLNDDPLVGRAIGQEEGSELIVGLLVSCVEAIRMKNITGINHFIAKLGDLVSIRGSSVSRLMAYFTEALALRVTRIWPHVFHLAPPHEFEREKVGGGGEALRLLNQISPIPRFIQFTSNEIILRAFEGKDRVHIIDFDVKQGLQWPSLFQSLAMKDNPPSHVRITGIGESKKDLMETGYRLSEFAEGLDLPFEFHPVVDRLEDVRLWMLHVKEGETVAVNCLLQLHKLLYDENGGALMDFLGLVKSTNPSILVLAEQEAEHNEGNLEMRLSNSLRYYSAIFDSINTSILCLDSQVRMKVEEGFGQEIRNIIACEGTDRVERHEKFEKWSRFMEQGGFRGVGIDERDVTQSKMILKMFCFESFRVEKRGGNEDGITMCWLDQPLYTVSAWKPVR